MIQIIPLTKEYLEQTIKLVSSIFPEDKELPSQLFKSSLEKEKYKKLMDSWKILDLEYFVALNEKKEVIGTTGLYLKQEDYQDSYWIGWYCVHPQHRGKGTGKKLLEFTITLAKKRGKKYLNLYTSTNPEEETAQKIYEKYGFKITNRKREKQGKYEIFFRKKEL